MTNTGARNMDMWLVGLSVPIRRNANVTLAGPDTGNALLIGRVKHGVRIINA